MRLAPALGQSSGKPASFFLAFLPFSDNDRNVTQICATFPQEPDHPAQMHAGNRKTPDFCLTLTFA